MGLFSSLFHSLFDVSTSSESTLPAGKSNNSSFNGHFSDYDQLYSDSSDCNLNYSDYVFLVNSPKPERCVQNVAFVFFPVRMCYPVLWI